MKKLAADPCFVAFVCFSLMIVLITARVIIGDAEVPLLNFFSTLWSKL